MDREETIKTPMGEMAAVFSPQGLKRLLLPPLPKSPPVACRGTGEYASKENDLSLLLSLYLSGVAVDFSGIEVDISGIGEFTQRVLLALRGVPYGQVVTYGELAEEVGNPRGQRAVGQAVGSNPVPIVVPCHRVVARNGLGGFSSGLEWKRWLLELESGV